jgi:formylglycine-generating enzyme required for sulfatase activity
LQGEYEGVITLFACAKDQKSYEVESLKHGAFTSALLKAIDRKDRYPTIRELSQYLRQAVPKLCKEHGKREQTPVFQVEGDLQWQLPALPNAEPIAQSPDLADLIQQARRAERAALNLIQNKYDDIEKLEIAKQKWWAILGIDPTHAEARQGLEEVLQLITRCQLEDELRRQIENELKWQKPEPSLNKQTEPNQYFISAEPGAVIQFASAPSSGDSEPVPAEVSRAVEPPPPAPSKPKPQPKPQPKPPDLFAGWELREWSFETVRVDRAGQVVERLQKTAKSHFVDLGEGVRLEMVAVPGGQFQMGSPDEEEKRDSDEGPVRTVTVPPLLVSRYPVTVEQWRRVAGSFPAVLNPQLNTDPSNWKDATGPIEYVNWFDAMEFCARLSKATDRLYRLPSEAEWEYACRGGTQTPFAFGETLTTELANYDGNYTYADGPKGEYRKRTTPIGQFPPNGFGLQDMHGNVWEWCLDDWHENYQNAPVDSRPWFNKQEHEQIFMRQFQENKQMNNGAFQKLIDVDNEQRKLLRGGSWFIVPRYCRSANRDWGRADDRVGFFYDCVGFRVVVLP